MEIGGKQFYGYELYSANISLNNGKKMLQNARPFNPETDVGDNVKRDNFSSNAQSRRDDRKKRRFE
jgi:hypothetical protein